MIHMVLADGDGEYVQHLARWFRENKPRQFQVSAFTEEESFSAYLQSEQAKADVIVLSDKFLKPGMEHQGNLIILGSSVMGLPSVDKYQTAPALCSAILTQVSEWNHILQGTQHSGKSSLVVCFSPQLRLKTKLALYLTKISQEHLYLNLEAFPYYPFQSECPGSRNLSNILYHIKASKGNLQIALESSVVNSRGINLIPPAENPGDLWELNEKETGILAQALSSWGQFSCIILDMEFNTSPATLQWLEQAACVIIPFTPDYAEMILRIKNMLEAIPGIGADKLRFVIAGSSDDKNLFSQFDRLYALPWLSESSANPFSADTQAYQDLSALILNK